MFNVGQYRVTFNHSKGSELVAEDFPNILSEALNDFCGITTCTIRKKGNVVSKATILCGNGNNNSKNHRRKKTLAVSLQNAFPSIKNLFLIYKKDDNIFRLARHNKRIRTLFWQAYSKKRGGFE